jgi:hypothetical protein
MSAVSFRLLVVREEPSAFWLAGALVLRIFADASMAVSFQLSVLSCLFLVARAEFSALRVAGVGRIVHVC